MRKNIIIACFHLPCIFAMDQNLNIAQTHHDDKIMPPLESREVEEMVAPSSRAQTSILPTAASLPPKTPHQILSQELFGPKGELPSSPDTFLCNTYGSSQSSGAPEMLDKFWATLITENGIIIPANSEKNLFIYNIKKCIPTFRNCLAKQTKSGTILNFDNIDENILFDFYEFCLNENHINSYKIKYDEQLLQELICLKLMNDCFTRSEPTLFMQNHNIFDVFSKFISDACADIFPKFMADQSIPSDYKMETLSLYGYHMIFLFRGLLKTVLDNSTALATDFSNAFFSSISPAMKKYLMKMSSSIPLAFQKINELGHMLPFNTFFGDFKISDLENSSKNIYVPADPSDIYGKKKDE
ncbi:MAG: hypothetical protein LBB12_01830 [Holosporaceae bacterium]|nr:hypothetical protein [Holosporaceae bacterium]